VTTSPQPLENPIAAGHDALAAGAWADAREAFQRALDRDATSAEAWEGLGWAAWWLADGPQTLEARERAYRAFRADGEPGAAARVAAWLASDFHEFRGEDAIASGWLERARRLLDGRPEDADYGWLCLHEGSFALNTRGDADTAARRAARAAALGREFGVADLEAVGLALEGIATVVRGSVEEGMRRLDEASAIAASEELQLPISQGWALCYLISACEGVGDFPRAAQWCQVTRAFAERWGARQLLGICRSSYGRVLATGGDWAAAEAELTAAVGDLEVSRPGMAGGGFVRLGELRMRQGRDDEARALFERAGTHPLALLGLGEMALDAGDPASAADAAERVLRGLADDNVMSRVPAFALLVRARAALSEFDAATTALDQLEQAGTRLGTAYVGGRVCLATAELAAARGDHDTARRACEDALDRFGECGAPYDGARARLALAGALAALGRSQAADAEARAARAAFAALGAARDVERAEAPLHDAPRSGALGDLTARELDVLRLVAQGLGDAEIADRLVLSPHTVHRHVANVRAKLRLPSRAAAVAYATRAGLL
jgi:ATP/maltotriose-dependent transcriptional regulator MalT